MTSPFIWTRNGRRISLVSPTVDDVACRRGTAMARRKFIPSLERLADKFWPRVIVRGIEECWPWTGHLDPDGYGRMGVPGAKRLNVKAPQAAWLLCHGDIGEGLVVCHRCDNPSCVNPAHLWIGTQADNVADMNMKGRARPPVTGPAPLPGEKNGRAVLNAESVFAIRSALLERRASVAELAEKYGVSGGAIIRAGRGQAWTHLGSVELGRIPRPSTRLYDLDGRRVTLTEAARSRGMKPDTVYARMRRYGMSFEEALSREDRRRP